MHSASTGLLSSAAEAHFWLQFMRGDPPPLLRFPLPPPQARRLLSCLVETAPLRLARSAAVRAQLRLPGTRVARFHFPTRSPPCRSCQPASQTWRCASCGDNVVGEGTGCTAMDQVFHVDCFVCMTCSSKLRGKPFYAVEKKAYCEPCYI
ncbi:hypothetical protein KUCAC02_022431, partial [Chaenocephalus aceratus]